MSRHHATIKNDPRWKAARAECLRRDGNECVGYGEAADCLGTDELHADHIIRLEERPDLAFDVENLQTLCRKCHEQKEREYASSRLIRNTWINPRYPELNDLIETETQIPMDDAPVF